MNRRHQSDLTYCGVEASSERPDLGLSLIQMLAGFLKRYCASNLEMTDLLPTLKCFCEVRRYLTYHCSAIQEHFSPAVTELPVANFDSIEAKDCFKNTPNHHLHYFTYLSRS